MMKKKAVLSFVFGATLLAASTMANTLQIGGDSLVRDIGWADAGMVGSSQVQTASYAKDGVIFHVTATTASGDLIPGANAALGVAGDGADDARVDGTEWIEFTVSVEDPSEKLQSLTVDGFAINNLTDTNRLFDVSDGTTTVTISNIPNQSVVSYTNELSALTALSLSNTNTWTVRFTSGQSAGINGAIGGIILNYEVPVEPPYAYAYLGGPLALRDIAYPAAGFVDGQVATGSVTVAGGITFTLEARTQAGWSMAFINGGVNVIGDGANDGRIDGTEWIEWRLLSVDDPEDKVKDIRVRGYTVNWLTATGEVFDNSDGTTTVPAGPFPNDTELRYDGALLGLTELSFATTNSWKLRVASANPSTSGTFGGLVVGYTLKNPIYTVNFGGYENRDVAWNASGLVGTNQDSVSYTTPDGVTVTVDLETDPAWSLNLSEGGRIYIDSGPGDSNTNRISDSEWVELTVSVDDPEGIIGGFGVEHIELDFVNKDGEAFEASDGSSTTNLVAIPTGTMITYDDYLSSLVALTNDNTSTWKIRFTSIDVGGPNPTEGSIAQFSFGYTHKSLLQLWQDQFGLTGADASMTADVEPDGLINLLEYAYGGNPTNDDAAAVSPKIMTVAQGGTNWFNYVYNRRIDAADRGLDYNVYSSENLVYGPITNQTEEAGSVAIDAEIESVTNRVSTDVLDAQFMKLDVSID